METGPPQRQSGATPKAKNTGKRGENVKFYLDPADQYTLSEAMREDGFPSRGPYLMHLLRQRQVWVDWRRARARKLLKDLDEAGVSLRDLEKEAGGIVL